MIKLLLCLAIISFTSFCGYLLGRKYRQKRQFFNQFKEFNERFLTEVTYYRRPILEFLSHYRYKGEFHAFLEDIIFSLEEKYSLDKYMKTNDYTFLTHEDKIFLNDYFSMFGRSDSVSQKAYFSSKKQAGSPTGSAPRAGLLIFQFRETRKASLPPTSERSRRRSTRPRTISCFCHTAFSAFCTSCMILVLSNSL